MSTTLQDNIAKVKQRISDAAQKYHRNPEIVQLLAVSKTQTAAAIREVAATGLINIGENYLQEALDKMAQLDDLPLCWHFIGPIQSNKTRPIAEHFQWIHSVDRLKIAQRLNEQRPAQLPALNICLQLNVNDEASKSGVSFNELAELADAIGKLPRLSLRGLMAIPKASTSFAEQRQNFTLVTKAFQDLQPQHPQLDTLSMGMSGDLEAAIAAGSTLVRIGTDIFGQRNTAVKR